MRCIRLHAFLGGASEQIISILLQLLLLISIISVHAADLARFQYEGTIPPLLDDSLACTGSTVSATEAQSSSVIGLTDIGTRGLQPQQLHQSRQSSALTFEPAQPDSGELDGMAEVQVAAVADSPCLYGWTYYDDSDASEGRASCLLVTEAPSASWVKALAACPVNSHLVTISSENSKGLLELSVKLASTGFWLGASQSSTAEFRNRGWAWCDGTPANNLNCGFEDAVGCGLWNADVPKYVDFLVVCFNALASLFLSMLSCLSCRDYAKAASEAHLMDYLVHLADYAALSDAADANAMSVCETEVSSHCPSGWAFYSDVKGYEGVDSCVWVSSAAAASWKVASSSCPYESHLLTVKSPIGTAGLLAFATSLVPTSEALYIGCMQTESASQRGGDWKWIDSTDSSNLFCANELGCGLWAATEPKCVALLLHLA